MASLAVKLPSGDECQVSYVDSDVSGGKKYLNFVLYDQEGAYDDFVPNVEDWPIIVDQVNTFLKNLKG